jgi:enoyl-CoA hydratase/carnithine racemase
VASEVTDGTVDVRRDRDIAIITLRRERKCNALSTHMETALLRVLRTGEVTTSLAVVVTGGHLGWVSTLLVRARKPPLRCGDSYQVVTEHDRVLRRFVAKVCPRRVHGRPSARPRRCDTDDRGRNRERPKHP